MARRVLYRGSHWRRCIHSSGAVLLAACSTCVGAAIFGVRSRMDRPLRTDGHCRLDGVEELGFSCNPISHHFVFCAARVECVMDLVVFSLASRRAGLRRNCGSMGVDCGYTRRLLANQTPGWRIAHSISVVGQLRFRAHLLGMAPESGVVGIALTSPDPNWNPVTIDPSEPTCRLVHAAVSNMLSRRV